MSTAPRLAFASITDEGDLDVRSEGYEPRWQDEAACRNLDPDLFFIERGAAIDDRCVAACRTCPVLAECRDHALHHEKFGYWAGMSERARRQTRKALNITLVEPEPVIAPSAPTTAEEVDRLTTEGYSVADIAAFLDISDRQVNRHRSAANDDKATP